MKTGWISKSLCLLCLGLSGVLGTAAWAKGETPTVLDRVQKVNDPELGELIRVAIENYKRSYHLDEKETLEIMRKVAQSYAQIKLLDQQIEQLARRIESERGPAEMRYELLLAKAELESKLTVELASLREAMLVVPRHAFERQPAETLDSWLSLTLIDDRVYALEGQKPFQEYWVSGRFKPLGLLSADEAMNCISQRLKDKSSLPIRVVIYHTPATKATAESLRERAVALAEQIQVQMEVEVRLELATSGGAGESPFFLRQAQIRTLYPTAVQRPDGGANPLVTGTVAPNDLEQHILWRLTMPRNVPLTFRIEHDEASAPVARQVAETATAVARRLGIADLVKVTPVLVQPVPEEAFLGRWQAVTNGELREVNIQPGGQAQLTVPKRSQRGEGVGNKTVSAPWVPGTKEIFLDAGDRVIYRASIGVEGNLVVDAGEITAQGSFLATGSTDQMIFKKAD